jgi:hypothetical protein
MFQNRSTRWTRTIRDTSIIIAIARKTPGINPAEIERWGGGAVVVGDQHLYPTPSPVTPRRKGVGVLVNMQELVKRQELRQQPAAYEVNLRPEVMCQEPDHWQPAYLTVCERYDTPRLTVVLQNIVFWTATLIFSLSFYYGLARLVMWAASL